jgi:phage-related protein
MLIEAAIKLFDAIIQAIPKIIAVLVQKLPDIIFLIVNTLTKPETIGVLLKAAVQMFMALITAIPKIIIELVKNLPQIINGIVKAIGTWWSTMSDAGLNLLKGLWQGISDAGAWLWNKISGFFGGIMDKIKNFFGIHSPSTLFENVIGKNLALGLGEGFVDEMNDVSKAMTHAIPTDFGIAVTPEIMGVNDISMKNQSQMLNNSDFLVSAFQKALQGMAFEIDGDKMGQLVVSKVERVVFA